jgi:hypothetical protein
VVQQADVDKDKDAGLNTYVVLTANSNMSLVRSNGLKAFVQASERPQFSGVGAETAGWELRDEIDMVEATPAGAAAARSQLTAIREGLPDDDRAHYNNYGKGVMFWNADADAEQYVNDFQHIVSADTYWFTDEDICVASQGGTLLTRGTRALTPSECHRASNYGATITRMRNLDGLDRARKPIWAFVELGHPFTESHWPTITAPQIRAAVWHSVIAGARGIIYFNHNFGGGCLSQHVLRDACGAVVRPTVRSVNRQVRNLAPVLNAPFVTSGWRNDADTKAMLKWSAGHFYLFAGAANNTASTGEFAIPCVGDATATVLGEGRSLPILRGRWRDAFADGNAVHIYRIDGGSSCGFR